VNNPIPVGARLASDGGGSDGINSSYADAFSTMISTVATVSAQNISL
jgi:hypothetical protein